MSNESPKNNMILKLELVELSKALKDYTERNDKFSFPNLADAYLEISRVLYKTLLDYHPKWRKLMIGHSDLLKLIQCIHEKETDPSGNEIKDKPGRISVRDNRNHVIRSMEFYVSEMQNLRENKINRYLIIISILSLLVSALSIIAYLIK